MKRWYLVTGILLLVCLGACKANKDHVSNSSASDKVETDSLVTPEPNKRPNRTEESTTSGEIYIAVDNALRPAIDAEINSFMGMYGEAIIHPIYLPGEEAIAAMLESDSIRLAIASRKLTEEEEKILESQFTFADYTEVGKDGVALLVDENNPLDTLSEALFYDLMAGKVNSWEQILPNSELGDVRIVFDHQRSGIIRFLQDSILGGEKIKGANFFALDSVRDVVNYINEHPEAVGMIGFSWISDWDLPEVRDLRKGTKLLAVGGVANDSLCPYDIGAFKPYQTYLTTDCYPLNRGIYTIRREVSIGLGTGFIAYLAGPRGQRVLHKHGIAAIKGIPRQVKFPPKEGALEPKARK